MRWRVIEKDTQHQPTATHEELSLKEKLNAPTLPYCRDLQVLFKCKETGGTVREILGGAHTIHWLGKRCLLGVRKILTIW